MLSSEIIAGADTVASVARHFARLQVSAKELLDTFRASERGYFTPSEDDEVRHLLVAYWQPRRALWEVVAGLQRLEAVPDEARPAAFLVAYAGALVLIDAARFLRMGCHERPVVREKLNEPEPAFGVPAGVYDLIQKSLTSPLHVWHVYHAIRYYHESEPLLRELGREDSRLGLLLEIIRKLQTQVEVGLHQYMRARAAVRADQALRMLRRDLLGRALYGLQKAVSQFLSEKYLRRGHSPSLPLDVADAIRKLVRPGDVLITRKEHAVTNHFLPGYWPHAALSVGDCAELARLGIATHANVAPRWRELLSCDPSEPRRVLEALKDGVRVRSLECPLTCDAIVVLRPLLDESQIGQALARGFLHEGKDYDFDFDFTRSDRLVCTEVVYRSYEGIGNIAFQLTRRAGRLTLSAEDLLRMAVDRRHFRVAAVYAQAHATSIATGSAAEYLVRATMRGEKHQCVDR